MRVVFMGTPDFALPTLKKLYDNHDVIAVYTQPDKPRGRKQILTPPDVKVLAESLNLEVYQPQTFKNNTQEIDNLKRLNPDVIVVAAYGKLLPKDVLDIPKYGCINVHGSILPKYRGAAPIQWSVLNGDKETGVTTMYMAEGLDTGDILEIAKLPINDDDTSLSMFEKLSELGAELLISTLDKLEKGNITRTKQNDELSSYAPMIDKSMAKIDFNDTAFNVSCKIRGLYDWPIAFTTYEGKNLKIHKARISDLSGEPNTVLSIEPLIIGCKDKSIEILELQLEGKKKIDSHSFILGHKLDIGQQFN